MKKVLKLNVFKNVVLPLAIFTATCGVFCGSVINQIKIEVCPLPDQETIKKRLTKIYSSEQEMFLLTPDWCNDINRMPCKKNTPIKVNVCFDANLIAHVAFDSAVEELNEFFEVVNPNYVFKMEYAPNEEDIKNKFNININSKDNLIGNRAALATTKSYLANSYNKIDGYELYSSTIDVQSSMFEEDVTRLKFIALHELCHCIGLGDAYENPYATTETIMQGWGYQPYVGLEVIDAATLAALYYDGTTPPEEVAEFVTDYKLVSKDLSQTASLEEKCANITTKNWKHFFENLDTNLLKQQISNLPNFQCYSKDLVQQLFAAIDIKNFDTSFGEEVFQAGEIFAPNSKDTKSMHYLSNQWENGRVYDLFQTKMGTVGCWLNTYGRTSTGQLTGPDQLLYIKIGDFVLSGTYEEKYDSISFVPDSVYQITEMSPTEYFAQFGIDCPAPKNQNTKYEKGL